MQILINVISVILATFGGIFALLTIKAAFFSKNKEPENTLYLKTYPDGQRAYRLGLKVNMENLKNGDRFEVIVKEESLTDTDVMIFKGVKE